LNIVIAGHFGFPVGSAAASRVRHLARGLVEQGHRVRAIIMRPCEAHGPAPVEDSWADYEGVYFRPAGAWGDPPRAKSRAGAALVALSGFARGGRDAAAWIRRLHASEGVDVVIGYSKQHAGINRVARACRALGIPVVRDVVEWLESDSYAFGVWNPLYWDSEWAMRRMAAMTDGVIGISQFLVDYFAQAGLPTLRVPAIIDPSLSEAATAVVDQPANARFTLTYLGNMVERDGPMLMIEAMREVIAAGHDIAFHVVGGTERIPAAQRAKALAESDPLLRDRVRFFGRVSDDEVTKHLANSDALVFTRMPSRAARAAFPTRLPEYLVTGRPVISSNVSDIGEYLHDGKHAMMVEPGNAGALARGIIRLLEFPDRGRALGKAGQARCRECFDYRKHASAVGAFLTQVRSRYTSASEQPALAPSD
jgi:glycosyltransferase involved in cell wall biosynthesis